VHVRLSTLKPIRAALTFQDLSTDTKFSPSQSRVTLPLKTDVRTEEGLLPDKFSMRKLRISLENDRSSMLLVVPSLFLGRCMA